MGVSPTQYVAESCPYCGKENAARMGSTKWGHDHYCCSDKCGRAFRDSPERWEREVDEAVAMLRDAARQLGICENQLQKALDRLMTDARSEVIGSITEEKKDG